MVTMDWQIFSKVLVSLLLLQLYQAGLSQGDQKIKVKPTGYDLNIQPFPEEKTFIGDVLIKVIWLEETNEITLNAHKHLTILDTKVFLVTSGATATKEPVKIQKLEKLDETNEYKIVLEKHFGVSEECEIKMNFSGKLNTVDTNGLFIKPYIESATEKLKWVIGSDFKPNFASTVFPCFDTPLFKVPFEVSIQRPSKSQSLSTMELAKTEDMGNGWYKDIFFKSPPMATFSLAIFVSDFIATEYTESGLILRIWYPPQLFKTTKDNRSKEIFKSLSLFEKYFGLKYPLPKLDYISLPNSMEINVRTSWGLIISSYTQSESDHFSAYPTTSYELVEQWIGNLVTISAWQEDSSVSGLTDYCVVNNDIKDSANEDQNLIELLLSNIYSTYYELANPSPSESEEIRRQVAVSKAEMVYRMLVYTLTQKTFLKTLQDFMKERQFKTFQMEDFWNSLTKQAYKDGNLPHGLLVNDIALSWIDVNRLPYISVTRNLNDNFVHLTQSLFLRKRPKHAARDEGLLWKLPIVLITQENLVFTNTKPNQWMIDGELTLNNTGNSNRFIIVNPEEIALYMVNYDNTNWNMLAQFLQSGERGRIPVITRAKLVHDALNLAYSGILDFETALNVTVYLKDERDILAWRPFMIMFDHISRHIDGSKASLKYKTFVKILAAPIYKQLNQNIQNLDKQSLELLKELRSTLRRIGYASILKVASKEYAKWMEDPVKGYKSVMQYLCPIFEHGTDEQWQFGLKTLLSIQGTSSGIDRNYLLKSLIGCASDHWKIQKILNMTIFEQNNVFSDDDIDFVLIMLTGGADGYMATFDYLQEHFSVLKERLQNNPEIWKQLIYTSTNLFKNQEGLNKVSAFYSEHAGQFGDAEDTIQNGLKTIKEEVQWTTIHLPQLEVWLDNFILQHNSEN